MNTERKIYEEIHKKKNRKIAPDSVRTNIIYFTTKCNLGCTYCYEALDEVKGINTDLEELYQIADEAIEREPRDQQTFFELFGGEPTLVWENVEKFMDYAYSKKKNVYFEMITNGIKFKDIEFINKVYSNIHVQQGRVSISVSFDGWNGNEDRIYRNGKQSREDVVEALSNLSYLNLPFRIRYSIHPKNLDHVLKDMENLITLFKPKRIITSEVTELLSENDFQKLYQIYKTLQYKWINHEIEIPICDIFCENCDGCTITRNKLQYYVKDFRYEKNSREEIPFNHFENLKKDKNENI